jgi:hypothetical protein
MGDIGEYWREHREYRSKKSLENFMQADVSGWNQYSILHWHRDLLGERLEFWPTKKKWRYKGKTMTGNVNEFIAKIERGVN